MKLKAALARVLGTAAIFAVLAFASLAFTSSAAEAHAGHGYEAAAPIASWAELSELVAEVDTAAILAGKSAFDPISREQDLNGHDMAELRSLPDVTPHRDLLVCGPGCCNGAPSHCSPALALGTDVSITPPLGVNAPRRDQGVLGIAGCDPEGIRKPPRTFA
jgi:hypothetical protein